jgi:hypothetical protein
MPFYAWETALCIAFYYTNLGTAWTGCINEKASFALNFLIGEFVIVKQWRFDFCVCRKTFTGLSTVSWIEN